MENESVKRVVSMVASENKITLFTIDGEIINMNNDGPHDTTEISKFLTPKLTELEPVSIDIDKYLVIQQVLKQNTNLEYEEEGIIVVQVIDGKKVQGIFYPEKVQVTIKVDKEDVVIPKVEHLTEHIKRASKDKSPSILNFFKRLGPIIKERRHSAEDLMEFIKKSEMPITNDGRIIAYKRVISHSDNGYYVDSHSKSIKQRVGSRVWMDIDAVDPNRNQSCSHGLHVANLGYLGGFYGDKTLVVVIDPEDFIAVPEGQDTKARVCSYDIVGVLNSTSHNVVNAGDHIDEDISFEQLISNIVQGNTVAITESVKVGDKEVLETKSIQVKIKKTLTKKASGKSLKTTKKEPVEMVKKIKESVRNATGNWDKVPNNVLAAFKLAYAGKSTNKQIADKVETSTRTLGRWNDKYNYNKFVRYMNKVPAKTKPVKKTKKPVTSKSVADVKKSIPEQAMEMFKTNKIADLIAFKKNKKKSWNSLGFTEKQEKTITKLIK